MARLASLILLGAAVASAHPNHAHRHAHKHRAVEAERAIGDTINAVINGVEVSWVQDSDYTGDEASTAATTSSPAADANVNVAASAAVSTSDATADASTYEAATSDDSITSSTTSSSSTTGFFVDTYTDFATIEENCSTSSSKRATLAQIKQVGNTGSTCYGSNFVVVSDEAVAAEYENTIKMYGATEDMVCAYWNKAGQDGLVDGWYKDKESYHTVDLPAGEAVYIAAANGTCGGASCFPKSTGLEYDQYGAIAGTWLEFTFIDVTTGWSAYDASCIIAENAGMNINGLEVCLEDGSTCSSIGAGLSSISAAFNAALAAADGIGGNFGSTIKIAANWGF